MWKGKWKNVVGSIGILVKKVMQLRRCNVCFLTISIKCLHSKFLMASPCEIPLFTTSCITWTRFQLKTFSKKKSPLQLHEVEVQLKTAESSHTNSSASLNFLPELFNINYNHFSPFLPYQEISRCLQRILKVLRLRLSEGKF